MKCSTWTKPRDARFQRFKVKCKPERFPKVLIIFTFAHEVLQQTNQTSNFCVLQNTTHILILSKKLRSCFIPQKFEISLIYSIITYRRKSPLMAPREAKEPWWCFWGTLMSARSSASCSSDMDADRSVSRRSSSAFFCRASRIITETQQNNQTRRAEKSSTAHLSKTCPSVRTHSGLNQINTVSSEGGFVVEHGSLWTQGQVWTSLFCRPIHQAKPAVWATAGVLVDRACRVLVTHDPAAEPPHKMTTPHKSQNVDGRGSLGRSSEE